MVCRFAIRRQNDHKLSVPYYIPSGKRLQNYRKSTISTAIFNSYVTNYRRVLFMMMVSSCFITIAWWTCTVTVRFVGDLFLDKPSLHVSLRPCRVREDLPPNTWWFSRSMLRGWSMPLCPYWILLDRRIAIKKQNYIPFKPPKNPNISPISVKVQSSPISSGRVWLVSFRLRPVLHARSHAHFEPRALNNCSDKGQRHAVFVECKRLWK